MENVFIIGSKGIPSNYGGFETFVEKLTQNKKTTEIKYHVSCLSNDYNEFEYNQARCFNVKVPNIGPAKAIYYDLKSLALSYKYIKENQVENPIIYILACRIGPFMKYYKRKFDDLSTPIFVNPDGHEWKRAKWNWLVRKYWKISERMMIKNADLVICDSLAIEKYILKEYELFTPQTEFIAYGANVNLKNNINSTEFESWLNKWEINKNEYYLIVGRFVEENNYELILREFMAAKTKKKLIIVTNIEKNKLYKELKKKTRFNLDDRIKFVGTIYDESLLSNIRRSAYGYLHGHEVGGTNPSLLEAMGSTSLNLLLDVSFNREVGDDAAIYFSKEENNLANKIEVVENISENEIELLGEKAKERIINEYSWEKIVNKYENRFLGNK
ncbi:TPA: DUF1972 domain-containing protein [Yersinia enterocolitica]|nr:DUF1972 domain-containing protein [Yersinia enterocolitica]